MMCFDVFRLGDKHVAYLLLSAVLRLVVVEGETETERERETEWVLWTG